MVTFEEFAKRVNGLEDFLKKKGADLLMKEADRIVDLNNKQLLQGLGTDAEIMQRGYSPAYGKRRKKAGLQTSFVDLKFTGKYQDSRKGVKAKDGINITSNVDYEKYLRGNFPKHVGLTKENAERVKELLIDEAAVLIKKYLVK